MLSCILSKKPKQVTACKWDFAPAKTQLFCYLPAMSKRRKSRPKVAAAWKVRELTLEKNNISCLLNDCSLSFWPKHLVGRKIEFCHSVWGYKKSKKIVLIEDTTNLFLRSQIMEISNIILQQLSKIRYHYSKELFSSWLEHMFDSSHLILVSFLEWPWTMTEVKNRYVCIPRVSLLC